MKVAPSILRVLGALTMAACTSTPPIEPMVSSTSSVALPPAGSSSAPAIALPVGTECVPSGKGTDYEVGPGKKFAAIGDVPLERLRAGDTVRIHYRPEPYKEKMMVSGVGRADAPIRICGVKGPNGELPVLDGNGATTRTTLDFPFDGHQVRGLIIVGWQHSAPWNVQPEHIMIEGLELKNASTPYHFTDKAKKDAAYSENASGIFVQRASHVTIRGNVVHGNENGLWMGSNGAEELTTDVLIEGNTVYDNGSVGNYFHHNVYNEASGVVYQFNHFGPPRGGPQGIMGANIKERSAGVVIRYNWIEDGAHLIDLVDSQEARDPNVKSPAFHESWVYGNVLVRGPIAGGSMVHYGGDSGMLETYRKGTLHFFHNTVVVENTKHKEYEGTAVFELSTNDENLASKNNVYFAQVTKPETPVVLLGVRDLVVSGNATFSGDWIRTGILSFSTARSDTKIVATVKGFDTALRGDAPGFAAAAKRDFKPSSSAAIKGKGARDADIANHPLKHQYGSPGKGDPRPSETAPTPGAFGAP